MDLRFTPAEEDFRAELRSWLAANVPSQWQRPGFWASLPDEESFRMRRDWERAKADAERAAQRKSQVGSGDRSERIRTYNFPQGRVSDHRINLTLYKIDRIMDGELDEIIDALIAADQAERLAELE